MIYIYIYIGKVYPLQLGDHGFNMWKQPFRLHYVHLSVPISSQQQEFHALGCPFICIVVQVSRVVSVIGREDIISVVIFEMSG